VVLCDKAMLNYSLGTGDNLFVFVSTIRNTVYAAKLIFSARLVRVALVMAVNEL
jgi:hypothetical protein